jgi:hypothetical protein
MQANHLSLGAPQPAVSLVDYAAGRLEALCAAARFSDEAERIVGAFRDLVTPWAEAPIGRRLGWVSDISDDNTPIEFSVAMAGERAEVRVLFEPQASEPTLAAYRREGLAFHERLERQYGADLARFRAVEDLFLPADMEGAFAVWSSAVFARNAAPAFKTYFNPQATGRQNARHLTETALQRLAMAGALASLDGTVIRRGELDELKYFALDLDGGPFSRVKIYVRHHQATAEDLELAASSATNHVPGEVAAFVRAMRGSDESLAVRAPFSCAAFVADGERLRPASTTIYVPVCAYARDDGAVLARIRRYLIDRGIDPTRYVALVEGFANRPLDAGVGMQAWFALRTHGGQTRFTVYLATEANRIHSPGSVPAPTTLIR